MKEWKADLVEVTVSGVIQTEHVFNTAGGILGVLTMKGVKSQGAFQGVEGGEVQLSRTNFWKSQYALLERGTELGSAKPPRAISRAFAVEYHGDQLVLIPGKGLTRIWRLLDDQGSVICELKPRSAFKRGALIQIFSSVEVKLLVFVYYLVFIRWREQSSAA